MVFKRVRFSADSIRQHLFRYPEPLFPFIDLLLVMSVNPGFAGQEFIPDVVSKIKFARRQFDAKNIPALIQVDGGVTPSTLPLLAIAGIDIAVAATAIFKHPAGILQGVKELRLSIK